MEITFITTGGTIDKDYPKSTKGYGFEISDPAIVRILERSNPNFKYDIVLVLKKDSIDMTEEDRSLIVDAAKIADTKNVIITHGTDAMIETAQKLNEIPESIGNNGSLAELFKTINPNTPAKE